GSTVAREISGCAIDLTVLDGIARPMPTLAPVWPAIWALTPTTSPLESSSGPPELPWLIAASVWIESLIVKLFGACIWRWTALTIPPVSVSSRPNGLPIATTASPTLTLLESPSVSGCRTDCGASTLITARSVDWSLPTTEALYVLPFQNRTETESALSTTCSFVTMCPSESITKPEPWAWASWFPIGVCWGDETVISTTPWYVWR